MREKKRKLKWIKIETEIIPNGILAMIGVSAFKGSDWPNSLTADTRNKYWLLSYSPCTSCLQSCKRLIISLINYKQNISPKIENLSNKNAIYIHTQHVYKYIFVSTKWQPYNITTPLVFEGYSTVLNIFHSTKQC